MSAASAVTRGGSPWTPRYLESIDADSCIGCGRCYKVCGRGVMAPIARPFDGDDEEDDLGTTVMAVSDREACIGCGACARTCAKRAHVHLEV